MFLSQLRLNFMPRILCKFSPFSTPKKLNFIYIKNNIYAGLRRIKIIFDLVPSTQRANTEFIKFLQSFSTLQTCGRTKTALHVYTSSGCGRKNQNINKTRFIQLLLLQKKKKPGAEISISLKHRSIILCRGSQDTCRLLPFLGNSEMYLELHTFFKTGPSLAIAQQPISRHANSIPNLLTIHFLRTSSDRKHLPLPSSIRTTTSAYSVENCVSVEGT